MDFYSLQTESGLSHGWDILYKRQRGSGRGLAAPSTHSRFPLRYNTHCGAREHHRWRSVADDENALEPSDQEIVVLVSEGQGVMKQEYYQEWHKQVNTTREVYQRLNDTCPGIVYPRQICDTSIVYPYEPSQRVLAEERYGAAVANATASRITADALLRLLRFAVIMIGTVFHLSIMNILSLYTVPPIWCPGGWD